MLKHRIGNDITLKWTLTRGGEAVNLSQVATKKLYAVAPMIRQELEFSISGTNNNVITTVFFGKDQKYCGAYHLQLVCNEGQNNMFSVDSADAVELRPVSAPDAVVIPTVEIASDMILPQNGLSAYEIAVLHGYQGTEAEWLAEYEAPQSAIGAAAEALESANDAAESATNATNAETSAISAATEAETSATNAATSATNAATSATNAATSASTATTKASEAASTKASIDQTIADLASQGESAVIVAQGAEITELSQKVGDFPEGESASSQIADLALEVSSINSDLNGQTETIIDLSSITANKGTLNKSNTPPTWSSLSSTVYYYKIVEVGANQRVVITANDSNVACYYCQLKSYDTPVAGADADICSGTSMAYVKSATTSEADFTTASDCKYLYIQTMSNGTDVTPSVKKVNGEGEGIKAQLEELSEIVDSEDIKEVKEWANGKDVTLDFGRSSTYSKKDNNIPKGTIVRVTEVTGGNRLSLYFCKNDSVVGTTTNPSEEDSIVIAYSTENLSFDITAPDPTIYPYILWKAYNGVSASMEYSIEGASVILADVDKKVNGDTENVTETFVFQTKIYDNPFKKGSALNFSVTIADNLWVRMYFMTTNEVDSGGHPLGNSIALFETKTDGTHTKSMSAPDPTIYPYISLKEYGVTKAVNASSTYTIKSLTTKVEELSISTPFNQWYGKKIFWLGTSVPFGQYSDESYAYNVCKNLGATLIQGSIPGCAIQSLKNDDGVVYPHSTSSGSGGGGGSFTMTKAEYATALNAGLTDIVIPETKPFYDGSLGGNGNKSSKYYATYENIFVEENADVDLWVLDICPNSEDYSMDDWTGFNPSSWTYKDGKSFAEHRFTFIGALLFLIDKIYTLNPYARFVLLQTSAHHYAECKDIYNTICGVYNIACIDVYKKLNKTPQSNAVIYSPTSGAHPVTFGHHVIGNMLTHEMLLIS